MKHDKILVPYDRSEGAKNAITYAVGILEEAPGAKLVLFTSIAGQKNVARLAGTGREGTGFVDEGTLSHYEKVRAKTLEKSIADMKADVAELVPESQGSFEFVAAFSPSPVEGILEAADTYDVDAICMGSRGVSAIAGMLGSVSFGVIRSAKVPVTVVK